MYTEGVSYYVIDLNYTGPNKQLYAELFMIDTLYINDMIVCYDWKSGLSFAEDSVTHDRTVPVVVSTVVVALMESDAGVYNWMYKRGATIEEF